MKRPNILLLYTDQQRHDALGCAGNPDILTLNLDRLASQSLMFTHHFVQNPVCMPSRASFLSGQYPETLGITHMGVPLPESIPLLPHYLKQYGYRTANIGKLHALPHANRDHRNPHPSYGFDHLEISDEPGPYEDAFRAWVRRKNPSALDHISVGLPPTAEVWNRTMGVEDPVQHPDDRLPMHAVPFKPGPDLSHTAFVSEQTREFISQQHAEPWLCISGFYSPHSPWVVPQKYLDLYDPAELKLPHPDVVADPRGRTDSVPDGTKLRSIVHGYYAMVSEVDEHVGRILDALEETGQRDNTIVIFTSDHGEWLGKFGRFGKGFPADDAISRVPLLMSIPETAPQVVDSIVEAVDVLPTILEACAIQVPPQLQGTSLLSFGDGRDRLGPNCAITEHHGWKTLRVDDFRYLIDESGHEWLFDLRTHEDATTDVSADPEYAEHLQRCRHRLLQRLLERERPLARTWTY